MKIHARCVTTGAVFDEMSARLDVEGLQIPEQRIPITFGDDCIGETAAIWKENGKLFFNGTVDDAYSKGLLDMCATGCSVVINSGAVRDGVYVVDSGDLMSLDVYVSQEVSR